MTAVMCSFQARIQSKTKQKWQISFPLQVSPINFETQIPFAHKPLQK